MFSKLVFSLTCEFWMVSQVTKWLMSKGQVLTWTTYDTLLLALFMDGRVDEVESIWNTIIQTYTRSVPKKLFSRMIQIYNARHLPDKVLEVKFDLFSYLSRRFRQPWPLNKFAAVSVLVIWVICSSLNGSFISSYPSLLIFHRICSPLGEWSVILNASQYVL
jgi:hypothetical protein